MHVVLSLQSAILFPQPLLRKGRFHASVLLLHNSIPSSSITNIKVPTTTVVCHEVLDAFLNRAQVAAITRDEKLICLHSCLAELKTHIC